MRPDAPDQSSPAWSQVLDPVGAERAPGPSAGAEAMGASRYLRGAAIGEGAMGLVVVAWDPWLRRHIALKSASGAARGFARRLQREAAILAQLTHPAIVPVFDGGMDADGSPWLAMRLVDGKTFEQVLAERVPGSNPAPLLRTLLAVCQGVAHAHAHGVLHRDLKPANILVDAQGGTQIIDWGLACVADAAEDIDDAEDKGPADGDAWRARDTSAAVGPGETSIGAIVGTPLTMSPEAARGERIGRPGDVFSLGVMLYEVAAGRPLRTPTSAAEALHMARAHGAPALTAGADLELSAIVACCLHPDPGQRYADAGALAHDLANFLDGRRVGAYAYSPTQLLRRLVYAWRWPLMGAAVALLAITGTAAVSAHRVVDERDRAQRAEVAASQALQRSRVDHATLQVRQAQVALEAGRYREAEALARAALADLTLAQLSAATAPTAAGAPAEGGVLTTTQQARGILAASAPLAALRLVEQRALPACGRRILGPGARLLACLAQSETTLEPLVPGLPRRSLPLVAIDAAFDAVSSTLLLRSAQHVVAFDLGQSVLHAYAPLFVGFAAPATWPQVAAPRGGWMQPTGGLLRTTTHGRQWMRDVCATGATAMAAVAAGPDVIVLCSDGAMRRCLGDPAPAAAPSHADLGPALRPHDLAAAATEDCATLGPSPLPARDVTALAASADALYVASARGTIVRCDLALHRCSAPVDAVSGLVRRLDVEGAWLMARSDRGDAALLSAATLELQLRSHHEDVSDAQLAAGTWRLAGAQLSRYALPPQPPAPRRALAPGLSLAAFAIEGDQIALGDNVGGVELRAMARHGAEASGATTRLQAGDGVVKAVTLAHDGAIVVAVSAFRSVAWRRGPGGYVQETLALPPSRRLATIRSADGTRQTIAAASFQEGVYALQVPDLRAERLGAADEDWLDLAATTDRHAAFGVATQSGAVWRLRHAPAGARLALERAQVAAQPGIRHVAAARADAPVFVADARALWAAAGAEGREAARLQVQGGDICDLAVSADGRAVVVGQVDGQVTVVRVAERAAPSAVATLRLQRERVANVLAAAPGALEGAGVVWLGSWDGTLQRVDLGVLDH